MNANDSLDRINTIDWIRHRSNSQACDPEYPVDHVKTWASLARLLARLGLVLIRVD